MKHIAVYVALAATLALAAGFAQAAPDGQSGWYAGIDLGRTNLGLSGGGIDSALAQQGIVGSTAISNQDTGTSLNLGYRFSKTFALEGDYTDLGTYSYTTTLNTVAPSTIQGNYKARAWSLSAVRILPMNDKWSLYGKAGLSRATTDLNASSTAGAAKLASASGSGTGLLLGAGATYDIAANWFGKVGLERHNSAKDPAGADRHGVNVFSLGMGVRF